MTKITCQDPECAFENRDTALFCGNCGHIFCDDGWSGLNRNNMMNRYIPFKSTGLSEKIPQSTYIQSFGNPLIDKKRLISFTGNEIRITRLNNIHDMSGVIDDVFAVPGGVVHSSSAVFMPPYVYYPTNGSIIRYHIGKSDAEIEEAEKNEFISHTYPIGIKSGEKSFLVLPYKKNSALFILTINKYHQIEDRTEITVGELFAAKNDAIGKIVYSPKTDQIIVLSKSHKISRVSLPSLGVDGCDEDIFDDAEIIESSVPCVIENMMYLLCLSAGNSISLIIKDLTGEFKTGYSVITEVDKLSRNLKTKYFLHPPLPFSDGVIVSKDETCFCTIKYNPAIGDTQARAQAIPVKNNGHWNALSIADDVLFLCDGEVKILDTKKCEDTSLWQIRDNKNDDLFVGFFFYEKYLYMVYEDYISFVALVNP
ncbi:MAG: hypothetical protein JW984_04455 [Deltaproteobacteria bacterium]|uniref:Uncharacterized protein n=1 Tax=Candidatus Zymogenus saltonus TaxID=2844893 RepID=A0A9D8KDW2_9DELT|nr:hypothetical protein [Candidatus Zymogenus saltonus]